MGLFDGNYTNPNDHIQAGQFEPHPDDIILEPTTDKHGQTVHAMPKDLNHELAELKETFNSASHEAQTVFIQKIVKAYPDEVIEFLKELRAS